MIDIITPPVVVIRVPLTPTPFALWDMLEQEAQAMLKLGGHPRVT